MKITLPFIPTHAVTRNGQTEHVLLIEEDGTAFTRDEWETEDSPDYERTPNDEWLFQGQPFSGTVQALAINHR